VDVISVNYERSAFVAQKVKVYYLRIRWKVTWLNAERHVARAFSVKVISSCFHFTASDSIVKFYCFTKLFHIWKKIFHCRIWLFCF